MKFACESCRAQYMISDDKVGPKGVKVRCKKCSHVNVVRRPEANARPSAAEAATRPSAFGGLDDELGAAFDGAVSSTPGPSAETTPGPDEDVPDFERTRILTIPEVERLVAEREATASAAEPAPARGRSEPRSAVAAEWFVAIDDEQVGPLTVEQLREKAETGAIDRESLCWKAGLADWTAVGSIPELSSVVGSLRSAPSYVAPAAPAAPVAAPFAAAEKTPVPAPAAKPAQPAWKPSAASALASLVEQEMVAARQPEVPAPEPTMERELPAIESTGIRMLLRDLPEPPAPEPSKYIPLAEARVKAAEPRAAAAAAPAPVAARAAPAMAAPAAKKSRAGLYAGVVAALLLVAGGGVFASGILGGAAPVPAPAPVAAAPAPAPVAAPAPAPAPAPVEAVAAAPAEPVAAAPAAEAVAPAPVEAAPAAPAAVEQPPAQVQQAVAAAAPKQAAPARTTTRSRTTTTSTRQAARQAPAPQPSGGGSLLDAAGSSSEIDSLFEQEFAAQKQPAKASGSKVGGTYIPPAPGSGSSKPRSLSQGDIMGVVVAHKGAIKSCVVDYKKDGGAGSGTVVMRWKVQPNGRTTGVQPIKGTEHKQLSSCIGGLIKGWRFPQYSGPQMAAIDFPFQF